ncbi:hypothetical protein [Chloroflexus aggregans]|nr:hypothetical protein [Chloroflexus aggregans]
MLAPVMSGWWRIPFTGAAGGPAVVCQAATNGAAAGTHFHRSYGLAGSNERVITVLPTSDNGFILVGFTNRNSPWYLGPYIVKVDGVGSVRWSRTYGDGNKGTGGAVAAADGGFWLAGSTDRDIYLVKMDADGNVQRAITYDGGALEGAGTILATSDGGFLLVGSTSPGYPSPVQALMVKLDGSGSVQWSRTYEVFYYPNGGTGTSLSSAVQTSDGGFLLGGNRTVYDYRTGQYTYSIILLKLNADGTVHQGWELTNPSFGDISLGNIGITTDGGVLLVGTTVVGANGNVRDDDMLAVKLDSAGNLQWSRTYGRAGVLDEGGTAVVQTLDGGFLLTGNTYNSSSGFDAYMLKIDGAGNVQWSRTYDGGGGESITTAVMAADGGFLLAGGTWPDSTAYDDMYVVRTDDLGEGTCNSAPATTVTATPAIAVQTFGVVDSSPAPLTVGTTAFPSAIPETQTENRCRYRLHLPLVVKGP